MLSSMYKNVDLVFVGTGNWTVYAYCGGGVFFSGLGEYGVWEVHSERAFFLFRRTLWKVWIFLISTVRWGIENRQSNTLRPFWV